jgi:hypothetical protein
MTVMSCIGGIIIISSYPDITSLTTAPLISILILVLSTIIWAAITVIVYNAQCMKELQARVAELEATEEPREVE